MNRESGVVSIYLRYEDRSVAMKQAQAEQYAKSFSELISKLLRVYIEGNRVHSSGKNFIDQPKSLNYGRVLLITKRGRIV